MSYTTYKDLRSISDFTDKTLLVIKAPSDTLMECDKDSEEEVRNNKNDLYYYRFTLQTYKMHLLSQNGPIDVLVCPDGDENETPVDTPTKGEKSQDIDCKDISLSSMASHDADLDGLMSVFPPLSEPGFLPSDMFESLSPPLNEDDFYTSLSPTEGILELFDLA